MRLIRVLFLCVCVATVAVFAAVPSKDVVLARLDLPRFQYFLGDSGELTLLDTWLKRSDLRDLRPYNPDVQNVYHLFTRNNPRVSQPLLLEADGLLRNSFFDPSRRTIVTLHGFLEVVNATFNQVLVPALLEAEDVNVIAVDWSAAGLNPNYLIVVAVYISQSAESIARFIRWLNMFTGANLSQYHIVGFSIGGQMSGMVGRLLNRQVPYITALDPAGSGFVTNPNCLRADDAGYTEVLHTNAPLRGSFRRFGHVDFFANGASVMPGCDDVSNCSHERSFYYFAESVRSGGFTGVGCNSVTEATAKACAGPRSLRMGGLTPKTSETGIYYLATKAAPPFSKDRPFGNKID